jgi:hypothetical protein
LHDLLFEPEREEVGQDIISWMEKKIRSWFWTSLQSLVDSLTG